MRRVHEEFPNIEIIVITGCATVESAAESVRIGICDYLQKPFDVVKVGAAIARAVSRRRARGSLRRSSRSSAPWSDATRTPQRSSTRSSGARSCAAGSPGCSRGARTGRGARGGRAAAHGRLPRGARGDDRDQGPVHARPRAAHVVLRRAARRAAGTLRRGAGAGAHRRVPARPRQGRRSDGVPAARGRARSERAQDHGAAPGDRRAPHRPLLLQSDSRSRSSTITSGGTARATRTGSWARTSRLPRASSRSRTPSTR